jgi:hypothetical protein
MEVKSGAGPTSSIDPDSGDPRYAYRPSMIGAVCELWLRADALEWHAGFRSGRMAYDQIRRIRLSRRLMNVQSDRFVAEVWSNAGAKIVIASTSWKSIAEQERLDRPYGGFLAELHRRLAAAGGAVSCETGSPPVMYWAGLVLFLATSVVLLALTVQALRSHETAGSLFVAGFLALFLWRLGTHFARNRPGVYRAETPPSNLVPR